MSAELALSLFSALVAVVAAAFAYRSSTQAKRNADKALGDIDPFIDVFQPEESMHGTRLPQIVVQITNHNRRPLLLHEVDVVVNAPYMAYRHSNEVDDMALAGIIDVYMSEDGELSRFDPPLRMAGNSLLGAPVQRQLQYQISERGGRQGSDAWKTLVGVTVEYSLGIEVPVSKKFEVVIHSWGIAEFRTRFRRFDKLPDPNA